MIPGYRLDRLLGRGASGSVHEGVQLATGRTVAVKVLDTVVGDDRTEARFRRERDAMAALAMHPHVVAILDAGITDGRPWLVMDLHRRGSLADTGPFPTTGAVTVLRGVASALAAAHARGLVHCDIKPANVLVDDHGQPVLGDFGIARLSLGAGTTGPAFTLDHAAPEVLDGHSGPGSDVWSLGTTVWQVLTGTPPFRRAGDATTAAVIRRIALDPLPRLDVDPELFDLLEAMTGKDPAERPRAAEVVAAASQLEAEPLAPPASAPILVGPSRTDHRPDLAALTGVAPPRLAAMSPTPAPAVDIGRRSRRTPIIVGIALAVLAAGSGGMVLARTAGSQAPPPATVAVPAPPVLSTAPLPQLPTTTVVDLAEEPRATTRRLPRRTTTSVASRAAAPPPVITTVVPAPETTTTTTTTGVFGGNGLFPGGG